VIICLVLVKIYGNSPIKLFIIINKNTLIKINVLPSNEVGPNNVLNSECILFNRLLIIIVLFEGISQNKGATIIIKIKDLDQFLINTIEEEGSNTENRLVIIFI